MAKQVDPTRYAAQSGKAVQTDGKIVNWADGIDENGNQRVLLTGSNGIQAKVDDDGNLLIKIAGTEDSGGGSLKVTLDNSTIRLPVDVQSRYPQTIQTHSGVMIGPTPATNSSGWMDCSEYNHIAVTALSSGNGIVAEVQWSNDGVNRHGGRGSKVINAPALNDGDGIVETRAKFFRVVLQNTNTEPQTMSTWAYLKA